MNTPDRYPLEQSSLDSLPQAAVALMLEPGQNDTEVPVHRHRKGQLVVAYRGGIVCTVPDGVWMVPPQFGVWIPAEIEHSNRVTANARVCFLLVERGIAALPDQCCTLMLSPLILELIAYLSEQDQAYPADSPVARLVGVLLEQLQQAPCEQLYLPLPKNLHLQAIAKALAEHPADRSTMAGWARRSAMSERSLARLIKQETGLTFGTWRRQWQIIVALQSLAEGVSVQRTAEALGYESVSSFIGMFRKTLGSPPARYMRSVVGRQG
jgi:AraC-like DNA-binding protein